MLPTPIMQTFTVWLALLGIASIGIGVLITFLASRNAPDGFEDQTGFHVGQKAEPSAGPRSPAWLDKDRSLPPIRRLSR